MDFIKEGKDSLFIQVKIRPCSQAQSIDITSTQGLRISLKASPQKNKANEELIKFLSKRLGIARSLINIKRGHTSKEKLIEVQGLSKKEALNLLNSV